MRKACDRIDRRDLIRANARHRFTQARKDAIPTNTLFPLRAIGYNSVAVNPVSAEKLKYMDAAAEVEILDNDSSAQIWQRYGIVR